jgi:hypothetical protein
MRSKEILCEKYNGRLVSPVRCGVELLPSHVHDRSMAEEKEIIRPPRRRHRTTSDPSWRVFREQSFVAGDVEESPLSFIAVVRLCSICDVDFMDVY